jgi:hypothetical protein
MAVFATGTRTFFISSNAPVGWTKDTTNYNEYTLRVVNGAATSGGSVNFTTAFTSQTITGTAPFSGLSSGSTVLGPTTLPSHTHKVGAGPNGPTSSTNYSSMSNPIYAAPAASTPSLINSTATGGGLGHSHPFGTVSVDISGQLDLSVKYVDTIVATKN